MAGKQKVTSTPIPSKAESSEYRDGGEINRGRFYNLVSEITIGEHERFNIGTYKEKSLHLIMKKYFEEDEGYHEVPVNGYIADICRDGIITEIQTSGFSGLVPKLDAFLPEYKVNLVLPLPYVKYVSWIEPDTYEIGARRKSPKKEDIWSAVFEVVRILKYVAHPSLNIIVPMLEMDEYRLRDGWSKDGKKGAHRYERIPTDIWDIKHLSSDEDYISLLPEICNEQFTAASFSKAIGRNSYITRAVLKVYEARGLIKVCGKSGRAYLYAKTF